MSRYVRWLALVCACFAASCGFPRPADVADDAGGALCNANAALRCTESTLIRCNDTGTAEIMESCALGCSASGLRCLDVDPSNALATALDMAKTEPGVNLGTTATLNTDDGTVMVDGRPTVVRSTTVAQASAPTIRVFLVGSLRAHDVKASGVNAIAIASNGDVTIDGAFDASAVVSTRGPGGHNDSNCIGTDIRTVGIAFSGAGGGGFAFAGGRGGTASNDGGTANGANGGMPTGSATLIPLRGGCDGGAVVAGAAGAGGGAIQLVSRTKITVVGVVAANGSSVVGGGSGGGILLEAPVIDVSGAVVANGGAGAAGCTLPIPGENTRYDAMPATGGAPCNASGGRGGNGAAGNFAAGVGVNVTQPGTAAVFGGHGGGSVGRIRVNTVAGGLRATGLFSPNPSTGSIATR